MTGRSSLPIARGGRCGGGTRPHLAAAVGTIFSILPAEGAAPLLQRGPQPARGRLHHIRSANRAGADRGRRHAHFLAASGRGGVPAREAQRPDPARDAGIRRQRLEFPVWDDAIKAYVIDCTLGEDGPRHANFNTRWIASLVAEAFRIFTRGGVFLYPDDNRKGYTRGRLRLLYEANPIAMLAEQAGGAATTGTQRILDIEPASLHQRIALVFGSKAEVEEIGHYYDAPHSQGGRSPLFAQRGLFRSVRG